VSKEREDEESEERRVRAVFPVNVAEWKQFQQDVRSRIAVEVSESEALSAVRRELQQIADIVSGISALWTSEASVIAPTASPEAFKTAVMRKVTGAAALLKRVADVKVSACTEALERVKSPHLRRSRTPSPQPRRTCSQNALRRLRSHTTHSTPSS